MEYHNLGKVDLEFDHKSMIVTAVVPVREQMGILGEWKNPADLFDRIGQFVTRELMFNNALYFYPKLPHSTVIESYRGE